MCQLIQYIVDWDALEIEIVGIVNDGEDVYRLSLIHISEPTRPEP